MAKAQTKKVEHDHHDHDHGGGHGGGSHDDHGGGGHCPPPWIITFADMSVLLMAFFVIMLMTAKTDQPKFNAFAAVMRETFGTIPLDERAGQGGISIINLSPGPQSGEPTDEPPATTPQSGNPEIENSGRADGNGNPGGANGTGNSPEETAARLGRAIQDALAQGEMTVASDEGQVVVKLPGGSDQQDAKAFAEALTKAISDMDAQEGGQAASTDSLQSDAGTTGKPSAIAEMAKGGATASEGDQGATLGDQPGRGDIRAEMAELQIGEVLDDQIADGDVKVQRQEGKVIVTIGAGGAFASGSADLTEQAQEIISELENVSQQAKRIVITGHTDDVPVSGGAFRDNWDLASARAQSVLRAIAESGVVPNAELEAVSKGETEPIADNETPEGREKNRRIEIEIEF